MIFESLMAFINTIIGMVYSWKSTKKLHKDMIHAFTRAPVNLFFDCTPIGRILNKFSKDLSELENELHW